MIAAWWCSVTWTSPRASGQPSPPGHLDEGTIVLSAVATVLEEVTWMSITRSMDSITHVAELAFSYRTAAHRRPIPVTNFTRLVE
jgi:hypothetical protein